MKKVEDSIFYEIKRIFKKKNNKINKFVEIVKHESIFVLFAYFVGILAIIIRNYYTGLPFHSINLIQSFVLFIYVLIFFKIYINNEYYYISIFNSKKISDKIINTVFLLFNSLSCFVLIGMFTKNVLL